MLYPAVSYRLPTSQVLAVAISDALRENPSVSSQHRLTELVREKLRQLDPDYMVTEERVRRVAIGSGLARVEVSTRDSGKRKKLSRCPVCGSKLRRVRNRTISGGTITLGQRCTSCPYSMGRTRRIPIRYVFTSTRPRRKDRAEEGQRTL